MRRLLLVMLIPLSFLLLVPGIAMAYEKEIKSLSSAMAEDIDKAGKKTIAVVDFTDLQGNVTELGRFIAEEFSVALAGAGKGFEVVDRTHLKSILAEHKLSATGIIDPQTARKLGQIAGVDALITGTITPFGDSVRLSVKVLATDTAKIIGASSGDIAKTKAIEELLARGIETGQPSTPQAFVPSYVPSTSSPRSKKIGNIIITAKRVVVSRDEIAVALDFFNQSDRELKLGIEHDDDVNLTDEKSNTFKYMKGIANTAGRFGFERASSLLPKSNNDVVVYFRPKDRITNIKDIGSNFTFSLKYKLYDPRDKELSYYDILFTDIKAQRSK